MAMPETIEKVRTSLRISHHKLDEAIGDTIDACLIDLKNCNVVNTAEDDPIILNALKLNAHAQPEFNDDPADCAAWADRYSQLKASLSYSVGYGI